MTRKQFWLVASPFLISLLLLAPTIAMYRNLLLHLDSVSWLAKHYAVTGLFFLAPLALFSRNLKGYYFFLLPWVLLTPVFIYFTIFLDTPPTFSLIALIIQTNPSELMETGEGYAGSLLAWIAGSWFAYHFLAKRFPLRQLPLRTSLIISAAALIIGGGYLAAKLRDSGGQMYLMGYEFYPVSIFTGVAEARSIIKQNNLDAAKDFKFNAISTDTGTARKVFVFVIGETSRYDHWSINGYPRTTSPLLGARANLLSFSNVSAGCNLTWQSVPQMITRANPDQMDLQFKEKSILAAFSEAGYKTAWISNQSDESIFWAGSITLHAKTAHYYNFPRYTSENYERDKYDDRMLPLIDSVVSNSDSNLFLVVHTIGNHFPYYHRYPKSFNHFRPSGYDRDINPDQARDKTLLINDYDNSIRHTDYILNEIIASVEKQKLESFVYFLSDHGEDLYDRHKNKAVFHLIPSKSTLHVPLFVWASEQYREKHPEIITTLQRHKDEKIGPEQTFYSLMHLSQITFPGFDHSRSIASKSFLPSRQRAFDNNYKRPISYSSMKK
jgi:glucan phosphoethanolaminetransferase (alkaline phosphatase superfamily)